MCTFMSAKHINLWFGIAYWLTLSAIFRDTWKITHFLHFNFFLQTRFIVCFFSWFTAERLEPVPSLLASEGLHCAHWWWLTWGTHSTPETAVWRSSFKEYASSFTDNGVSDFVTDHCVSVNRLVNVSLWKQISECLCKRINECVSLEMDIVFASKQICECV